VAAIRANQPANTWPLVAWSALGQSGLTKKAEPRATKKYETTCDFPNNCKRQRPLAPATG